MTGAQKRVLDMVADGKISSTEGDQLLKAMEGKKRAGFKRLVDPFAGISPAAGLIIGAVAAALSVAVALALGVRWDGFLDLHVGSDVRVLEAALDQVVAWPLSALALWVIARLFNKGARFVDFLSVVGVARVIHLVAGPLVAVLSPPQEVMEEVAAAAMSNPMGVLGMLAGMVPALVVGVVLFAWFVTALVFGVRYASGLRRGKLVAAVLLGFFLAEVVSKLTLLTTLFV